MNMDRIPLVIESLFSIQTKSGRQVPFILNDAQRFFVRNRTNRTIIAKARQKGFSSYILAEFAARCLGIPGTHAVVMSHEAQATQRLLDRADFYLRHIRGPRPSFGRHSRNEMYFKKTESSFYIGTAGSKAFGRGDTITDLHCSEYAWWEKAELHHAGVFQAVPLAGRIVIESTGNGRANDFYFIWLNADKMGYTRLFYPWYADDEYTLPVGSWQPDTPGFNHVMREMQERFRLSNQQMAWWEHKFRELRENLKLMNQEYPSSPEDCFQASGGALFTNVELAESSEWMDSQRLFGQFCSFLLGHPRPGFNYVVGVDPAGGTGNDDAAVVIFCCETGEQVFRFANNTIQPIALADFVCRVARHYNEAFVVCEANNHGVAVVEYLKTNYPRNRLYKSRPATMRTAPRYGWLNSKQTKHMLVDTMQDYLGNVTLYDSMTVSELISYEEVEEGKFRGRSDNLVIATGLAILGLIKFESLRGRHLEPQPLPEKDVPKPDNYMYYTLDEILDNIGKRAGRREEWERSWSGPWLH